LTNRLGRNPLHSACEYGSLSNVVALFAYGVDLSLPDASGDTALHIAARVRAFRLKHASWSKF
jgi:ankyrin repeat protein